MVHTLQIDGETVKTVAAFILGASNITNLDRILKSRDITLPTKVHLVKAMVFSSGRIWM